MYFHPWTASPSELFHQRERRGRKLCTAASSGLSKPLILSIWLDCKNASLFFNQWKLNYPDSWGTLEYINIFWQAWVCSPSTITKPLATHSPTVGNIPSSVLPYFFPLLSHPSLALVSISPLSANFVLTLTLISHSLGDLCNCNMTISGRR